MATLPKPGAMVGVGPPLLARRPRLRAAVVVAATTVGRPVLWVARLSLPRTVLLLLTISEPPLLLAKMVLMRVARAPAAVPMVVVSVKAVSTPFRPSV